MSQWLKFGCLAICLFSMTNVTLAGVVVGGTRVVYKSEKKETSITITNPDKTTSYLIQSWVESESNSPAAKAPFIITPPLFRLEAGQENILRIVRIGGQLPDDRESMYWLSVKSIPSTEQTEQNSLQISVKTRIKLFYRPAGLIGNANEAYKSLKFNQNHTKLHVSNPTPYHVSFYNIKIGTEEIKDAGTIAPYSTRNWIVPANARGKISWQAINDYGGISESANTIP